MKMWVLPVLIGLLVSMVAVKPVDSDPLGLFEHSKLGIHGIVSDGIVGYVQSAVDGGTHFSVVKAVDDLGYLASVKNISPDTITVARLTHEHEGAGMVNQSTTNLQWYAGVIMDIILAKIDSQPELADVVDYWEPINEPLGGGVSADVYERLARLMIYCMDLAEARDKPLRLALFSFNAGTPEWIDMTTIVETGVFARAKAGGHILALHEGVFDKEDPIDLGYGAGYSIPSAPQILDTGVLCGRYRYWYYLLEQRDEVVPLFISEFYAGGGYGSEADVADIVARMRWYDNQLRRDDYALGFGPFTLGPVGNWRKQDYGFAYPALVEYMIEAANAYSVVYMPLLKRETAKAKTHFLFLPMVQKSQIALRDAAHR